jgi:3-oxoadipate enol-lactonase
MAAVAEVTLPIWFSEKTRTENPAIVEKARGWITSTSEGGYIGASDALKVLDLKRKLKDIRVPTLFVVGALDGPHPKEMREMAALVEGARFEEIADAGHVANLEQPTRFLKIVRAFLKG